MIINEGLLLDNKILVFDDFQKNIEKVLVNGNIKKCYPLKFPVNSFFIEIEEYDGDYKVELIIKDGVLEFEYKIENGKLISEDIGDDLLKIKKVSEEIIENRRMIACELFGSDEIFLEQLSEKTEDIESAFDEGENLSVEIAEKTSFIEAEEEANQYINYFVVTSPESVQKKILMSYKL